MTKLLLRFCTFSGYGTPECNQTIAKGLLMMTSILRLGTDVNTKHPIDRNSRDRINLCIRTLLSPKVTSHVFLERCNAAHKNVLQLDRQERETDDGKEEKKVRQPDELITIRQLRGAQQETDLNDDNADMSRALETKTTAANRFNRVYQLTGFADPVYAEANLTVLDYDIVMEVLVVNQTPSILQNLVVELSTSRDLKVVDRPQVHNVAAHDFVKLTVNVKVSSTESGVIFGNIVYGSASGAAKTVVVLNSIHMDIVDYINPAKCDNVRFRKMWAEFEWENKVAVHTDIGNVRDYLDHIIKITNMQCLTSNGSLPGDSGFLAANLYARSIFGEDAVLNVCVQQRKDKDGKSKVMGYIRIRCKSQGIALSLGDKITNKQRHAITEGG